MCCGVAVLSLSQLLSSVGTATQCIDQCLIDFMPLGEPADALNVHVQCDGFAAKPKRQEKVQLEIIAIPDGASPAAQLLDAADEVECAADAVSFLQVHLATVTTKRQYCSTAKLFIPPAVLCLLGAVMLFAVFRSILGASCDANVPVTFALSLGVFCSFQENMLFTVVLVHAFGFTHSLGAGAVFSGVLIGIHKMGTASGTVLLCTGVRIKPELWRYSQPILLLGAWLQTTSAVAFGALGFTALEYSNVKLPLDAVLTVLLIARFLQGLGGGLQVGLAWNQAAQLTSGHGRGIQNMRVFVGGCLGLGAGPLIISAVWWMAAAMPCTASLGSSGMLPLVAALPLMQLAVMLPLEMPSLKGVPNMGEQVITTGISAGWWRVIVIFFCICMQILRNLALSSLEAGVSILFETNYGWRTDMVGLGTCAMVFAALPVQLIWEQLKPIMALEAWTIMMLWTSTVAASFLRLHGGMVLLGSSLILFPLMALSSGLIMSRMQDCAFPRGSLLDLNTSTLLGLVVADFAGRGGGPIAARWSVSRMGQGGFAWLLVSCCGATTFLYHVIVCGSRYWQDHGKKPKNDSTPSAALPTKGVLPPK